MITKIKTVKTGIVNIIATEAACTSYQDTEYQKFTLRKNKGVFGDC